MSDEIDGSNSSSFICTIQDNILDSEYDDINLEQCYILHIADFIYSFQVGPICIALLALIIAISIFGGMKEHYRWFLLNQGIWDALCSINYYCGSEISNYVGPRSNPKCDILWFFGDEYEILVPIAPNSPYGFLYISNKRIAEVFTLTVIKFLPYSAVFLLSASRFFAIFFPNFYEKLTKNRRLLYIIIAFNIFNLLIYSGPILNLVIQNYIHDLHRRYGVPPLVQVYYQNNFQWPFNCTNINCFYEKDIFLSIGYKINDILRYLHPSMKYFYIAFSIIASIALMIRIVIQAKFQLIHNRRDFFISLRISTVIFLQTFLLTILFSIEFFVSYIPFMINLFFGVYVLTSDSASCPKNMKCINYILPKWIVGRYGIHSDANTAAIRELRILFECFFILFIMAGYFEVLKTFIKFCYFFLRHPKKSLAKFKALNVSSKVVSISR